MLLVNPFLHTFCIIFQTSFFNNDWYHRVSKWEPQNINKSQKNAKAAAGETKFGRFSVKLPTELGGVLGNKATKLEKPRAVLKTDVDSAKEIQKVVKGKGIKFRMMKRKDHVAVYLDFADGDQLKAAMAKVKKIK